MFLTKRDNPYYEYTLKGDEQTNLAAIGRRSGIGENFAAQYGSAAYLTSYRADAAIYAELYKQNVEEINKLTGGEFQSYDWALPNFQDVIKSFDGVSHGGNGNPVFDAIVEQNSRIDALKEKYPQIRTTRELWGDAKERAKQMELDASEIAERAGALGTVSGFIGGIAGSFTSADPANVLSTFVGLGGKTLISKMLYEAGLNSGVEAINQFTGVPDARKRLGLEELSTEDKLKQVVFAGVGGAAFRGGIEVAPKGFKAIEEKLFPIHERLIKDLDRSLYDQKAYQRINDYLDNNISMSERDKLISKRVLDGELILVRNNPYDKSPDGLKLFEEDVNDFVSVLETGMTRQELLGGSSRLAFNDRISPDAALDLSGNPKVKAAREENPEIFKALDEQQAKVNELENRINEIDASIKARTIEDSVEISDPILGDRIRAVNKELSGNITKKRRNALEKERDLISESLDVNSLRKAESDYLIGEKRSLRSMRSSLDSQKRKLRDIKKQAHKAIDDIIKREQLLASMINPKKVPSGRRLALVKSDMTLDDAGKAMYSSLKKSLPQPDKSNGKGGEKVTDKFSFPKDGKVMIGEREIDLNSDVPFDAVIKDDNVVEVKTMKVRDVLKDIEDDNNLVKAMETCLL